MKVKHVLEALNKYNPEDELIIDWWAKDFVQEWFDDENEIITDELWCKTVHNFENGNYSEFSDQLIDYISENMEKVKV